MEITDVKLKNIIENFDSSLKLTSYTRIPTGKYNTSYYVRTNAGMFVLRIAPPKDSVFLFYERDNMLAEPEIHEIVLKQTNIRIPEIYLLDDSEKIIPVRYMIMEYLPAEPGVFSSFQLGKMVRELHEVSLNSYGYIWKNRPMEPQKEWKSAFFIMWDKLMDDIYSVGHLSSEELLKIKELPKKYERIFEYDAQSCLLHMDIWHQNILVDKHNKIYLVDWDRALAGDIEIEFAVLDYCGILTNEFKRGYGIDKYPNFNDININIRHTFYYLYELMKYIVIEQGRRNNYNKASEYKRYAMSMINRLLNT